MMRFLVFVVLAFSIAWNSSVFGQRDDSTSRAILFLTGEKKATISPIAAGSDKKIDKFAEARKSGFDAEKFLLSDTVLKPLARKLADVYPDKKHSEIVALLKAGFSFETKTKASTIHLSSKFNPTIYSVAFLDLWIKEIRHQNLVHFQKKIRNAHAKNQQATEAVANEDDSSELFKRRIEDIQNHRKSLTASLAELNVSKQNGDLNYKTLARSFSNSDPKSMDISDLKKLIAKTIEKTKEDQPIISESDVRDRIYRLRSEKAKMLAKYENEHPK